jgi:hypothetical protein
MKWTGVPTSPPAELLVGMTKEDNENKPMNLTLRKVFAEMLKGEVKDG